MIKKGYKNKLSIILILLCITLLVPNIGNAQTIHNNNNTCTININGEYVELRDGEKIEIPLIFVYDSPDGTITPYDTEVGLGGKVSLTYNYVTKRLHYSIVPSVPLISFTGGISVTNLTTGFSHGTTPISLSNLSGTVPVREMPGHIFLAHLFGVGIVSPNISVRVKDVTERWVMPII